MSDDRGTVVAPFQIGETPLRGYPKALCGYALYGFPTHLWGTIGDPYLDQGRWMTERSGLSCEGKECYAVLARVSTLPNEVHNGVDWDSKREAAWLAGPKFREQRQACFLKLDRVAADGQPSNSRIINRDIANSRSYPIEDLAIKGIRGRYSRRVLSLQPA